METSVSSGLEAARLNAESPEGFEIDGKYRIGPPFNAVERAGAEQQGIYETWRDGHPAIVRLLSPETEGRASELVAGFAAGQKMRHPNLLEVYDFGEVRVHGTKCVYVVTERPDENLAGVLRQRALNENEARQILEGVIPALEYLHERGYVHGSVRPSEVLACGEKVKLSSDGIRPVSAGRDFGDAPGLYGAPETATGRFGPASDAWSLAVLTLEALTRSPYPSEIDRLSPPFRDIVEGGLRRDAASRWSAGRMSDALAGRSQALPQAAAGVTATYAKQARYKQMAGLAVGGALAAAAVCALLIRSAHQAPAAAPVTIEAPPVTKVVPESKPAAAGVPAGWAVVGAAYHRAADAEKRAGEIRRAHPQLNPRVLEGGDRYLVLFGAGFSTQALAKRRLEQARRGGAPRESYLTHFR